MRIEFLRAFVAVVEQGSFSKAGELLYLSQPTISRYIGEIEKRLGGVLFMRNAHSCEVTLLGKQVYIHARRIINEWKSIEELATTESCAQRLMIRIGYNNEEALKFITPALTRSGLSSDKVEIAVRFGDGKDIVSLVREGKLDCAIMHLPSVVGANGLEIRQICKCEMCLHASEKHRLAKQHKIKLEQLVYETDVRISGELSFYRQIDEAFSRLNLPKMKHVYVHNLMDCLPNICYKNCITISPDVNPPWPGCVKIPIEDWMTDFSLVFVTREGTVLEATERLYKTLCATMKRE